jgi:hypothetical protein
MQLSNVRIPTLLYAAQFRCAYDCIVYIWRLDYDIGSWCSSHWWLYPRSGGTDRRCLHTLSLMTCVYDSAHVEPIAQVLRSSTFRLNSLRMQLRQCEVICREMDSGGDLIDTGVNLLLTKVMDISSRRHPPSQSSWWLSRLAFNIMQRSYIQIVGENVMFTMLCPSLSVFIPTERKTAQFLLGANFCFSLLIAILPGSIRVANESQDCEFWGCRKHPVYTPADRCVQGHLQCYFAVPVTCRFISSTYLYLSFFGTFGLGLVFVRLYVQV